MQNQNQFLPRLVETKTIIDIQTKYGHQTDKNLSIIINLVFLLMLLISVFFLYDRYNKKQKKHYDKNPNFQKYLM